MTQIKIKFLPESKFVKISIMIAEAELEQSYILSNLQAGYYKLSKKFYNGIHIAFSTVKGELIQMIAEAFKNIEQKPIFELVEYDDSDEVNSAITSLKILNLIKGD